MELKVIIIVPIKSNGYSFLIFKFALLERCLYTDYTHIIGNRCKLKKAKPLPSPLFMFNTSTPLQLKTLVMPNCLLANSGSPVSRCVLLFLPGSLRSWMPFTEKMEAAEEKSWESGVRSHKGAYFTRTNTESCATYMKHTHMLEKLRWGEVWKGLGW